MGMSDAPTSIIEISGILRENMIVV
jgi:hypothetical protein